MRRGVCTIDDCARFVLARGWCALHYQRWRKHGDPLVGRSDARGAQVGQNAGPASVHWRGDDAGYVAIHDRLRKLRGPASSHTCPCGAPARQWAYRGGCLRERWGYTNTGHMAAYSPDPDRYDALCLKCHKTQGPPLLAMLAERAVERSAA